jgi:uncharacterized protein (TIGR02452 family)
MNSRTDVEVLPVVDSETRAERNRQWLEMPRYTAAALGRETVAILDAGHYTAPTGELQSLGEALQHAVAAKVSIPPDAPLSATDAGTPAEKLVISVENDTTLNVSRRLLDQGRRPLALNFAAPTHPGGGFLSGDRAQEENIARSSGLYATLIGDAMYDYHRSHHDPAATDWAILSPDVPVFRGDSGQLLPVPWLLSILTCAAPQARRMEGGTGEAAKLLRARIHRVLSIAWAYGYRDLVLGAWGCGAFGCDPTTTAADLRDALLGPFLGAFETVVFAITDWSPERRYLAPFRDAFATEKEQEV